MSKPDSNLNPAAQPWGRWIEEGIKRSDENDEEFRNTLERLLQGDGGQASVIAGLQAQIETLRYELVFLYGAIGQAYPPVVAPPAPPVVTAPETREITADWSRTWGTSSYYTGGGEYTNAQYLYQGSNPENKVGMWRFDLGPALGKTITDAQIFLQNVNSPWSASFVAQFGTHSNVTAPVGKPGRVNGFDVGWGRGEGKWVGVPDWARDGLSNGSIQGFTVGASGASDPNSAYFMGVGQPNPPRLKVTYLV